MSADIAGSALGPEPRAARTRSRVDRVLGLRVAGVPAAVPATIAVAWATAIVAQATGNAELLSHTALLEGDLAPAVALPLFHLSWLLMLAGMMLPSIVPMVRLFAAASERQPRPGAVMTRFLGGYALVWVGFGSLAFAADVVLHEVVALLPWLDARPWLIAAGALALAGAFQFSDLKDRCLTECRHPAAFLLSRYRQRGPAAAFRFGRDHGLSCLGCCWALMLLMFAVGASNLAWMAGLGAVMVYEKIGRHGERVAQIAGIGLLAWAASVAMQPAWLPPALSGLG